MCMSIKNSHPENVLAEGSHAGHEWIVTHNGSGFRFGYVKVEPGHPWHGEDHDDVSADAHGGLTFSEDDEPCKNGGPDNGWWLGFDCAHWNDAPDPSLPHKGDRLFAPLADRVVRTQEYVESECRRLCEQAAEALSSEPQQEIDNDI